MREFLDAFLIPIPKAEGDNGGTFFLPIRRRNNPDAQFFQPLYEIICQFEETVPDIFKAYGLEIMQSFLEGEDGL